MTFEAKTIAIGSDHRARGIVDSLASHLEGGGWSVTKHYGGDTDSVDYPVPAKEVTGAIQNGDACCGVLICGSGIGMSMAANKETGIRAALVHDSHSAEMSRKHNNANVLCMAADGPFNPDFPSILDSWLSTEFEGGRHQRRVDLMA